MLQYLKVQMTNIPLFTISEMVGHSPINPQYPTTVLRADLQATSSISDLNLLIQCITSLHLHPIYYTLHEYPNLIFITSPPFPPPPTLLYYTNAPFPSSRNRAIPSCDTHAVDPSPAVTISSPVCCGFHALSEPWGWCRM